MCCCIEMNDVTDPLLDANSTVESKRNPVVNLTGIANGGERYLSQERFGDSVSTVDCTDNAIKFVFRNPEAFEQAEESWKWVNKGNRTITVVLSAGTCGNDKRKPYIANHVSFGNQSVTVEAAPSVWQDAVRHAKLLLNTQGLAPGNSSNNPSTGDLQRRQFGIIGDITNRIGDAVTKFSTIREQKSLDLSADFSGRTLFSQAINNTELSASIECNECRTRGGLDLNIEFEILNGFSGFVEVRPSNLGADVVFDVSASPSNPSCRGTMLITGFSSRLAERSLRPCRRKSVYPQYHLEASQLVPSASAPSSEC